ncbi:hypothetical protein SETIT_5G018100v2 [Setaria italica]|uniref:Uncharacterized protein n=1 Tax=Setaria italica TaxID=4555 RepID=K3XQB2_SETIT|nr:nucleolin [Setaria italica]RCV23581.1 hypothetical protein SETIT_5G018100v2 [Setaria italica]
MEAAGAAAKFCALAAELAAKSSHVAELEARVSLLEAENERLREALARREGAGDPKSGRLAAGLRRSKHEEAEKLGGGAACDIIELSDYEEGPAAVDANEGQSPEEGVVAAPTPRNRVVSSESEDEADAEDAEGGGGSNMENGAGLEDEDVSVTPRGKRRAAARVVTSDSEDEDVKGGELGSGNDDADDQEEGVKASRKRGLCGISDSDDEMEDVTGGVHVVVSKAASRVVAAQIESGDDEDDMVPISQVLKKMRKERASEDDADDGLHEAKGCSTRTTRRSARLVRNQSKGERGSRRVNNFVEPKDYEGSEDDMEEDNDTDGFINDSSSESASGSDEESHDVSGTSVLNEESSPRPEESDPVADYAGVMAHIGRKKKAKDWKFEADMLAAFAEHPELCLKAVCALYRKQTQEEQLEKAALLHNKQGFSHIDAHWGSCIAEFLLDGDRDGPLKKTIDDLEEHDSNALGFCRRVASNYSKQLFAIYQNKEDPYFHP